MHRIDVRILDARLRESLAPLRHPRIGRTRLACPYRSAGQNSSWRHHACTDGLAIHLADPGLAAMILLALRLGPQARHRAGQPRWADRFRLPGRNHGVDLNRGKDAFTLNPLDRLAQLVVVPVLQVAFNAVVDEFDESQRGDGGFGSTGKS